MNQEHLAMLIEKAKECVLYIRLQDYFQGSAVFREWTSLLGNSAILQEASELREGFLPQLLQALESGDMILLADYLEEGVVPFLQSVLVPFKPIETEYYRIEMTSSGQKTVYAKYAKRYLHSNNNPAEEARIFAEHCYDPQKSRYAVWGCGLGYHIAGLYEISKKSIKITVYEEDEELLFLFRKYGIIEEGEDIRLVWDEFGKKFSHDISDPETGILMHYPSIMKIRNKKFQEVMQDFYADWNGIIQNRLEMVINFRKNTANCNRVVDELEPVIRDRDVVIIGGGPSVDSCVEFLQNPSGKIVFAVNTIVPSLLGMDIRPDYILALDTQPVISEDLVEARGRGIPLIVASTACWLLADGYDGERYIAFQSGNSQAKEAANAAGVRVYETGGSVVTLAVSIAAKLGAKSIYFIGVDLAQPRGQSHARNTKRAWTNEDADLKQVRSVTGELVETDLLLLSFKKWIENAIPKYPGTTFYNLSNCGADIAGTIHIDADKL